MLLQSTSDDVFLFQLFWNFINTYLTLMHLFLLTLESVGAQPSRHWNIGLANVQCTELFRKIAGP